MEEERFFVAELTGVQYTCGIGGICSGKCEENGKCGKGISRQEAIERMAKAMCQSLNHCGTCSYKNDKEKCEAAIDFHWGFEAETALNALLEHFGDANEMKEAQTIEERVEEITKNNPGIPDYDDFYKALKEGK